MTGMKETLEDEQVKDTLYNSTAGQLRAFVERYERLDEEKSEIAEQMKEVLAEAKGSGFDTKALRKILAMRKRDRDELAEEEAIVTLYREALGM